MNQFHVTSRPEELNKNRDCLNTIRLIAALQVVFGHTARWLELPVSDVVEHSLSLIQGVPVFFMMSGFLIWFSIGRSKSFKEYALKRFWRLYPELWVAVIFEMLVIVVMYDHPIEWGKFMLFGISESTICLWVPEFLRDYGTGVPNGVLWTMFCLLKFYLIGYFLYKWMRERPIYVWLIVISILIILGHLSEYAGYINDNYIPHFKFFWFQSTLPFLWMFVLGNFLAEYWLGGAKKVVMKIWPYALLIAAFVEFFGIDWNCSDPDYGYELVRCICILIWTIGLAYSVPKLNVKKDISYPIYLYHMTIVQILFVLGYRHSYVLLVIVIAATSILSYFSTIYIGQWSKNKKQNIIASLEKSKLL